MALSVNNNTAAINTYRNLTATQSALGKSLEKLSSGYRINRAADDAAGLAISEGLRSQVSGLQQASRNAQDGINVVQTAEGALNESTSILQRMRTLSVQAASSGSLSDDAKNNIQAEVSQLKDELSRIAKTTSFNGRNLLDGSSTGPLQFQVGANKGETLSVNLTKAMDAATLGVGGVDVTVDSSAAATGTVTKAIASTRGSVSITNTTTGNATTDLSADATANFSTLNGTISYGGKNLNLASVDYGTATTAAAKLTKLNDAAKAAFGGTTNYFTVSTTSVVFTPTDAAPGATPTARELADKTPVFTKATGADDALTAIDAAIQTVSTTRANLGAVQNRLEHTIANLGVSTENLTASESSIRDTDMAKEMTQFTSRQILAQAGTAMLAQAKNLPQSVLSLLQG